MCAHEQFSDFSCPFNATYNELIHISVERDMATSATKAIAIKIDQATQDRVNRLADLRQRTPHSMMKDALSQYLDREEKRESFRNDAISAWNEYQATGSHVDGSEVTAWLETWGEENEQATPKCHK